MPKNNTYEGDVGIKYKFVTDHDETEEESTDDIFADDNDETTVLTGTSEGLNDVTHYYSDKSQLFDMDEHNPSGKGFSVLSDDERKYRWEKQAEPDISKRKKSKNTKNTPRRSTETENDEYYDLEIGNSSAGLKILMSLMLISFIVIISILVYRLTELNERHEEVLKELEAAPTLEEIDDLKAEVLYKEQSIKQLTDELSRYRADNAVSGELVETPEGWIYVVAANDTLGRIAQQNEVSVGQIMEWNNLENADNIKIGQKLIVKKTEEPED